MKELDLLKERITQASRLLPWWASLIMAEVSFVTLYLLETGLLWMVIVSSFFIAASIFASFETEQQQQEMRRREAEAERMPVTKVIVKDLMKGKYQESFIEARQKQEKQYLENFSKTMTVGIIAITMIISTVIMVRVSSSRAKEKEKLAKSDVPKPAKIIYIPAKPSVPVQKTVSVEPVKQNWKKIDYLAEPAFKRSPEGEKILSYRVFLKDGGELDCEEVKRKDEEFFQLTCGKLYAEYHINRIKDMERRTEVPPNGKRVTVIKPENFPF